MRERLADLGGRLEIESSPGSGTVAARAPPRRARDERRAAGHDPPRAGVLLIVAGLLALTRGRGPLPPLAELAWLVALAFAAHAVWRLLERRAALGVRLVAHGGLVLLAASTTACCRGPPSWAGSRWRSGGSTPRRATVDGAPAGRSSRPER